MYVSDQRFVATGAAPGGAPAIAPTVAIYDNTASIVVINSGDTNDGIVGISPAVKVGQSPVGGTNAITLGPGDSFEFPCGVLRIRGATFALVYSGDTTFEIVYKNALQSC